MVRGTTEFNEYIYIYILQIGTAFFCCKLGQPLLQNRAAITNQGKMY